MELVKNIFFNTDKLIENTKIKISYSGFLFENNSQEVYIHYGFDDSWKDLNEIKMEKTDLGFQTEIYLPNYSTFNFCFRNSNNEWDNNQNTDYIFNIEKPNLSLTTLTNTAKIIEHKKLKKSYLWGKKFKLTVYKFIKFFPKLFTKNCDKKLSEN